MLMTCNYPRNDTCSDKLTNISLAHKASAISEKAERTSGMLHINTDGTTFNRKKLMVL